MTDENVLPFDDPWEQVAAGMALGMAVAHIISEITDAPVFQMASQMLEGMAENEALPSKIRQGAMTAVQRHQAEAAAQPKLDVAKAPLLGPDGRPL